MAAGEEQQGTPQEHTQPTNGGGTSDANQLAVVGIGASAGGIQALQTFFHAIPPDTGIVFVVVMHLSPDRESALPQVLQTYTAMPVRQVSDRVRMEPDHVYVIPPNQHIKITDGYLEVTTFAEPRWQRAPIDVFFRTLAEVHPDGIGILLSGSGTDGTVGLQAIKECGGIAMVQLPEEAEFDAMPRSAIATGLIDFVLPVAELAAKVVELHQYGLPPGLHVDSEDLPESETDILRRILVRLQVSTGHDFSGYKNSTVLRRIERRMRVTQVETHAAYLEYLRCTPHEARALLKDLLISVTHFFRDPAAFEALQQQVIPRLFEDKAPGETIRVWVAGCATGEEAYSIAMLLLEQVDTTQSEPAIQIFASDPDEDALAFGREGLYPAAITADVSEARLQRFFVREGTYYRVRKELREMILFAAHSLLKAPPFSQLDLISCRNLLIYFQRELQDKVYQLFHYALKPQGYLFLGSAESIEGSNSLFQEVDKAHRIYHRASSAHGMVRLPDLPLSTEVLGRMPRLGPHVVSLQQESSNAEQHRQALETHAPPSLVVDADATIVHISETANQYLQFSPGTPSLNLIRTILPELRLEMRTALFRATERRQATTTVPLPADVRGQRRLLQLFITPTPSGLVLVVFLDTPMLEAGIPRVAAPGAEGDDSQLRQMEEALEMTKAQLRSALESAETQQEELRAANEELQSINEEYKSTLEELETSKEELQSINEELKTVNQELNNKVEDLSQANNNLQNLMVATDVPTLFVDRQLTIRLYTSSLTKIFNIMPVDQGRPLEHVTHRLTYERLLRDVQQVLDTLVPVEREVSQDNEAYYLMRLMPYRTTDDYIDGVVITFVDITARQRAEAARQGLTEQLEMELSDARALQHISTLLIQEGNVDVLYRQILDAAIALMRADAGSIQRFEAERSALRLLVWQGFHPESAALWEWVDTDSKGSSGEALSAGRRVVVPDTETCAFMAGTPDLEAYRRSGLRAMQSTPLISRSGRLLGMLSTHWRRTYQPPERDLRLLDVLARQAADLIERAQTEVALQQANTGLEQRVAERTAALEQAHDHLRSEMAERQRMQEALFQREKLASLGLLLANVAHELNNPLSVATMEIDNLEETWPASLDTDALDTLRQAVERCNSVVQSFLTLARQHSTTRGTVALNALIDEVLILLRHALEADGIALELNLADNLPPLQADANQLHHVLSNLITNAQHALRQSKPPRQVRLTTAVNTAGTQITLEVTDNGPGIPAEVQRRLFEPFFTTRAQEGGNGLGLSLCRSVIEGHGGTIELSSQVGHGTTVHISLPVATSSDVQALETTAATEAPAAARRGRILLIDDEPGVQRSLQRLLQRSGHEVTTVANGHEGLMALEASAYDVILCDIRMPDLDGPGFYREVERRYPHLVSRVIFLTGDVLSPEAQSFFAQVVCPRLVKPFQAQEIRRRIQQMLEAQ
jgi:two-component system CheB/CheR fusion protein